MIKVYISPDYSNAPKNADNGGIRRVVEAMVEHFPAFGIVVVHNPDEAEVIINHGTMLVEREGVPSIHVSHGMYWSRQPWGDGFHEVNENLVESMAHAVAHTVPSEWVGVAVRRGGYYYPEVVYHGVDAHKFIPSKTYKDYVIWNKARADYVSDPADMQKLAAVMPNRMFRSTIGFERENVKILGVIPHDQMKREVSEAGLYLSTVRETFGIGVLEALAYGVPVVGFDWGGNSEIIIQGETGYLAPPGDFKMLAQMTEAAFANRKRLSENAIQDARTRWKWEPRIKQYADMVKRVYKQWYSKKPKVSIIVTAYKLDQYLPTCLNSVIGQTFSDFECLVVDDASLESTEMIVRQYEGKDSRFKYLPTPNNFGLVGARNFGLDQSRASLIRHLDADDFLAPNALALEVAYMDKNRGVHIAYGHLGVVDEKDKVVLERAEWPPQKFNWYQQMAHLNQLPSCSMVRREVYERSGGYRERMKRNEDAEFWCRVTSLGFRAQKFTEAVTYWHRDRADSKGATEWATQGSEPDWTAWFPWRMGCFDYRSASEYFKKRGENPPNAQIVPFGAQGKPPRGMRFWYVHDYAYPVVSVIVTCGPTHRQYLLDALDSVQAQTYTDWECIVVNDTGEKWGSDIMGAPWAKVVNMEGNQGASAARNAGFMKSKGKYVVWLDADDYWLPWFLETLVSYAELNDGVIYSDFFEDKGEKELSIFRYMDFMPQFLSKGCATPGSSILVPRKYAEMVKWDTEIPGIEDWDFQYQLCDAQACFFHVAEPLFVYRKYSTTKREKDHQRVDEVVKYMDAKWAKYRVKGEKLMCGCTKPKKPVAKPVSTMSSSGTFSPESVQSEETNPMTMVSVEYLGHGGERINIRSIVDRNITYRFDEGHRVRTTYLADAERLASIMNKENKPIYRIIQGEDANQSGRDPQAFLSRPITV